MSKIDETYERISRYLKGLLSDRERHDLEKDMMQDVFDEEAFEGLSQLNAEEFDSGMSALMNRMDERIHQSKGFKPLWFYRIAAGIIFFAGLGTILYLFLKTPSTGMISQQVHQEEKSAPPETAIPSAPALPESIGPVSEDKNKGIIIQKQEDKNQPLQIKPEAVEEMKVESEVSRDITLDEAADMAVPQASAQYKKQAAITDSTIKLPVTGYITGRVLGVNRQALSGAYITETGSARSTVSDANGNFRLRVQDAGAKLILSYVGYKPMELTARDVGGKEIFLDEDLVALNEVVVVGYGTQNRSRSEKAVKETSRKARADKPAPYKYIKPVPPGGTLWGFEKWVESRIDTAKFMELLPGKYKIQVSILVNSDGMLGDVTVKNDVPGIVADEYKRVVSQSSSWLPASIGTAAIEAEVLIIFLLTVE